jgi:hypothetical protein
LHEQSPPFVGPAPDTDALAVHLKAWDPRQVRNDLGEWARTAGGGRAANEEATRRAFERNVPPGRADRAKPGDYVQGPGGRRRKIARVEPAADGKITLHFDDGKLQTVGAGSPMKFAVPPLSGIRKNWKAWLRLALSGELFPQRAREQVTGPNGFRAGPAPAFSVNAGDFVRDGDETEPLRVLRADTDPDDPSKILIEREGGPPVRRSRNEAVDVVTLPGGDDDRD